MKVKDCEHLSADPPIEDALSPNTPRIRNLMMLWKSIESVFILLRQGE